MDSPFALAQSAADELRARSGVDRYDVAVVLGSGWREGASALGEPEFDVATTSLPGFFSPTVAGHGGHVLSLRVGERRVALLTGRVHLYEGHSAAHVVHPIRTLIAAGASSVVLTNACGGIDPTMAPGETVLIRDQVNLTGTSPLEGEAPPEGYGSRFVDLSDLYSARIRSLIKAEMPDLREGVYLGLRGPHYETPAEITMARTMGASLVGMSTVLESIAARHLGAEVVGLSLVSNHAAGVVPGALDHREVLAAGQQAAPRLGALLAAVLALL
ncbi:MAG TPA: purine-nucleoside phosphorylase [Acidimicrobiales bacterium]|nr:purine-nucleoside phosphorylase [Acidimicrobiales bacterium]